MPVKNRNENHFKQQTKTIHTAIKQTHTYTQTPIHAQVEFLMVLL